ncbi:MAG TPA: adenylyl-sulfate kinase [Bacteroidia bacterium]|jgi:adenylylsulfate kinase
MKGLFYFTEMNTNIFPTDKILARVDKEEFLGQKGIALWMTGLSGSGKTTIAIALEKELNAKGVLTQVLDGDNIRSGINNNLGFSGADRKENIRRIAEVAKLFVHCGIVTICCFVSPTEEIRQVAKDIIGKDDFVEIFVNTPLEICEQRDVKGLYAKARKGEIKDLTGVNAPFDIPAHPDITIDTSKQSVEQGVQLITGFLENRI